MVSSGEVSECWRPIIVRGKSCEIYETSRIRKFEGQRCGRRTHCWRRVIRRHRTVHPGSRRKSDRQHCLLQPPRQAVSGWRSVKRNGRPNIAAHGGSMSRMWAESHCTQETGHQLLTDWTEISEIDRHLAWAAIVRCRLTKRPMRYLTALVLNVRKPLIPG